MNRRPWTAEDISLVSDPSHTHQFCAVALDRSEAAIRGQRQRLARAAALEAERMKDPAYAAGKALSAQLMSKVGDAISKGSPWNTIVEGGAWTTSNVNAENPTAVCATTAPAVDPLIEAAKTIPAEFGNIPLDVFDGDAWTKIGLVSDTHLCCREERLDALHAQYDLFQREGVKDVFHAGNIVDGYIPRINGASVIETSIDGQALYCARNYPQRDGITTHFITGDDHEGWWQKEGFNFGAYLQMVCERLQRFDMKYIGHVEADVELKCGEFINRMKIQHPGGGSAYARSYKGQKMVESFQGGEKPAILVQGHYHVSGYSFDRNVHIVGMPGFKDQDMFTRKQHLRCEIGGVILEFKMSSQTGAITRIRPEFNMFFDRGFYKKFLPSDSMLRGAPKTIITGK